MLPLNFPSEAMPRVRIHTKCVTEPIERERDGLRLAVTRYLPRGGRRSRYDVWLPNLGPSEALLRSFQAGETSWPQFAKAYQVELFESAPVDEDNPRIKNHGQKFTLRLVKELATRQPVTLLCSCAPEEKHCHRHVLKKLLTSSKV
jgi:uncharacterized protein YeaO (DUF488 family)